MAAVTLKASHNYLKLLVNPAELLEALALTPWSLSLNNAIAATSSNCIRSVKTIARHFERFADGEETKQQANQEIADHLLAFARQFSADSKPV